MIYVIRDTVLRNKAYVKQITQILLQYRDVNFEWKKKKSVWGSYKYQGLNIFSPGDLCWIQDKWAFLDLLCQFQFGSTY